MNADFDALMEGFFHGVDVVFGSVVEFIGAISRPTLGPFIGNVWVRLVLLLIISQVVIFLMLYSKRWHMFNVGVEFRLQFCPRIGVVAITLFALNPEYGMTFENYADWDSDPYGTFIILLIVGLLTMGLYAWFGWGHLIRYLGGLAVAGLGASLYVDLRDFVYMLLEKHELALIWSILYVVLPFIEGMTFVLLLVGLFVCYMPSSIVASVNNAMSSAFANAPSGDTGSAAAGEAVPSYARNSSGDTLNVSIRDDYIVIDTPQGEKSVRREYVKGENYVNIDGEKYYINYK